MPALRLKTCRLLPRNVQNKELTIIQCHILRKLRNKKRFIKKKIYSKKFLTITSNYKLHESCPFFHGNLPITKMHRGAERTSYIPFVLGPETRLYIIPIRLHFCETIPQARQPISHRKVCVNNLIVKITNFKVSHDDIIYFQENDARTHSEEIRRFFYIKISIENIIGKFMPVRIWRRTTKEWFRLLKTKKGCRLLQKNGFCKSYVLLLKKKT